MESVASKKSGNEKEGEPAVVQIVGPKKNPKNV
jgi:hypothetical protein